MTRYLFILVNFLLISAISGSESNADGAIKDSIIEKKGNDKLSASPFTALLGCTILQLCYCYL